MIGDVLYKIKIKRFMKIRLGAATYLTLATVTYPLDET